MWDEEEITARNSDQPQIFKAVLAPWCASLELLGEVGAQLEELAVASVACFAKLPFPLGVNPSDSFVVASGRDDAKTTLTFRHFMINEGSAGEIRFKGLAHGSDKQLRGVGTQVVAFIALWGRHLRYHQKYLSCLGPQGLENRLLNNSLWRHKRAPAGYDGISIDSIRYEDELNRAVILAFHFSMKVFLDNYNIVAFDDLRYPDQVAAVFTMPGPGRVSFTSKPISPFEQMLQRAWMPVAVSKERLDLALRFGRREFDRYQRQLLAMQRLARGGEPELAVIGCVTAIEWFLNLLLITREPGSLSIKKCLPKPMKVTLSAEMKNRLSKVADRRNECVHRQAPVKRHEPSSPADRTIDDVVSTGIDLYREVQLKSKIGLID
jgi:hypothetical protein